MLVKNAEKMRRYRERQRLGLVLETFEIDQDWIAGLIERGDLTAEEAADPYLKQIRLGELIEAWSVTE